MLKFLILLALPSFAAAATCDDLFNDREKGLTEATAAYNCFETELKNSSELTIKSHAYRQMSYLKFYIAEYFLDQKMPTLLQAVDLAERGMLLFGKKYDVESYLKLSPELKSTLGWLLYNYGLSTSRYVDLAGKFEAIKRMEDIKKSMNSIIRMKEEATSFFGAHRTLGIFHMKVPAIAGGRIELSGQYLEKAVSSTLYDNSLSFFPGNNLALSDLYFKLNKKTEACEQTRMVAQLSESDVRKLDNGHFLETMNSVMKARELLQSRKCL